MLDLQFVRTNLELVEEKLRARGADPAALLGDFRALDKNRREAITQSEQLKARRNELSQQVGALKKAGKNDDAAAVMDETRALKDKLEEAETYLFDDACLVRTERNYARGDDDDYRINSNQHLHL